MGSKSKRLEKVLNFAPSPNGEGDSAVLMGEVLAASLPVPS